MSIDLNTPMTTAVFKRISVDEYLRHLDSACRWLSISDGRGLHYKRQLEKYRNVENLSNSELLTYFESFDLVELFRFWESRVQLYPNLKKEIRKVFMKGPEYRRNENPTNSNTHARNNTFPLLLAGRFLSAGIHVLQVDGAYQQESTVCHNSDFTLSRFGSEINVECKRPFSMKKLVVRAKEARDQILDSPRNGIVAIDCSRLVQKDDTVFDNSRENQAVDYALTFMEREILPELLVVFCTRVCGLILYCRIPAMTPIDKLNSMGEHFLRRDCAMSLLCVANNYYSVDYDLMHDIFKKLGESNYLHEMS